MYDISIISFYTSFEIFCVFAQVKVSLGSQLCRGVNIKTNLSVTLQVLYDVSLPNALFRINVTVELITGIQFVII